MPLRLRGLSKLSLKLTDVFDQQNQNQTEGDKNIKTKSSMVRNKTGTSQVRATLKAQKRNVFKICSGLFL